MILFSKKYSWTPANSQKDISFSFVVPKRITAIKIHFSYSPGKEEGEQLCVPAIERALTRYYDRYDRSIQSMQAEQFLPIKNLLTLSFDKDGVYLGNAHRWQPEQQHIFTCTNASLGFEPPERMDGKWNGMIHIHEILSKHCKGNLIVEGLDIG